MLAMYTILNFSIIKLIMVNGYTVVFCVTMVTFYVMLT